MQIAEVSPRHWQQRGLESHGCNRDDVGIDVGNLFGHFYCTWGPTTLRTIAAHPDLGIPKSITFYQH